MTKRQIKKELQRQAVLFEERVARGQVLDGNINFGPTLSCGISSYPSPQKTNEAFLRKMQELAETNCQAQRIAPTAMQTVLLFFCNR